MKTYLRPCAQTLLCSAIAALPLALALVAAPSVAQGQQRASTAATQSGGDGVEDIVTGAGVGKSDPSLPTFRREKGTTQHTADDVQAPGRPQESQTNPPYVKLADPSAQGTQGPSKPKQGGEFTWHVEKGEAARTGTGSPPNVRVIDGTQPSTARFSQNGTTVPTADEVQAPQDEEQASLMLPAVQKVRDAARPK